MCEIRVLRRIFGSEREEVTGGWRSSYIMRSSSIFILHLILLGE
jgi:hypothetical protein